MVPALFVSDPGGCAFHATVAINVVIAVAKDGTAVDGLPSALQAEQRRVSIPRQHRVSDKNFGPLANCDQAARIVGNDGSKQHDCGRCIACACSNPNAAVTIAHN
jgi:hypothetical protein